MVFRQSRRNSLISRRMAIDLAEYRPCFQFAFLDRSRPSGVRGPVLLPPCILHLPFFIAGALQGVPFLVLAPHLGPFIKLFFAQGLFIAYFCPPPWLTTPTTACPPALTWTCSTIIFCSPPVRYFFKASICAMKVRSILVA